ncbi:MAG: metallophosphoesterase [Candidatus Paceibacterota bacterium]
MKKVSYDVVIDNLPSGWEDKKAILFSDTHYGLVNNKKAAQRLVDLVEKENPDMVFIAGDFFDGLI